MGVLQPSTKSRGGETEARPTEKRPTGAPAADTDDNKGGGGTATEETDIAGGNTQREPKETNEQQGLPPKSRLLK